jgi:aerobic-type carbon monoxide dehydrogenase small subunit (CoxS/CutS family)
MECEINGRPAVLTGDPAAPVVGALRARGLYSVRETCGVGVCGTCTVLLDGEPVSTCILPLYALDGRSVRTAEGLADRNQLSELQEQFIASQAFQCSFCTPGFLMSATALLEGTDGPLDSDAVERGLQGHLCRCGCYMAISEAVQACSQRVCGAR